MTIITFRDCFFPIILLGIEAGCLEQNVYSGFISDITAAIDQPVKWQMLSTG